MRNVIVEERSWRAEADQQSDQESDRREHRDPVTAALVNYSYARV